MNRRTPLAVLGAGAVAAAALAVPATAQSPSPKLTIRGGVIVKPGVSIMDNQRYTGTRTVESGATLTISNRATTKDPHSFSLVKATDVPKTAGKVNGCFEGGICGKLAQAHEATDDGPPKKPLVDVGSEGFDQAGDSVFFQGKSQKVKITAKSGTSLSYICAIHPWMQGKLKVN